MKARVKHSVGDIVEVTPCLDQLPAGIYRATDGTFWPARLLEFLEDHPDSPDVPRGDPPEAEPAGAVMVSRLPVGARFMFPRMLVWMQNGQLHTGNVGEAHVPPRAVEPVLMRASSSALSSRFQLRQAPNCQDVPYLIVAPAHVSGWLCGAGPQCLAMAMPRDAADSRDPGIDDVLWAPAGAVTTALFDALTCFLERQREKEPDASSFCILEDTADEAPPGTVRIQIDFHSRNVEMACRVRELWDALLARAVDPRAFQKSESLDDES